MIKLRMQSENHLFCKRKISDFSPKHQQLFVKKLWKYTLCILQSMAKMQGASSNDQNFTCVLNGV